MNLRTSRRSTIDYTDVIPPQTIVRVADTDSPRGSNCRPRKRERSLVNFENELTTVNRGSPRTIIGHHRSSVGVEVQLNGPAGWAVTETTPRPKKVEEIDESEGSSSCMQPSPGRRRPRTAWSDDGDTERDVESPAFTQNGSVGSMNLGFVAASDDDEDGCSVGKMLEEIQRKIEDAESRLAAWGDVRAAAERDAADARLELSGRVGELEAVLRHCTELAVADLSRRSAEYLEEVESCVRATETHILGMRKIVKRYTRLPADNQHTQMLKKLLNKVQKQSSKALSPSTWSRHMEESAQPADIQLHLLQRCLGLPSLDPVPAEERSSSRLRVLGAPEVSLDLPAGFLQEPRLIHTISCKSKKDRKPCGITDVALTDDGRLFVADFLNKAVKIYDSIQDQKSIVLDGGPDPSRHGSDPAVIPGRSSASYDDERHKVGLPFSVACNQRGQLAVADYWNCSRRKQGLRQNVIGRPSRITYVPSTNSIIVTDDQARHLRMFSGDLWIQQCSISLPTTAGGARLLHFPSGHCMTPDGSRLAVIDFESKSVVVWNTKSSDKQRRSGGAESETVVVCQTGLLCPGNVAVTRSGQLAVTDSKVNQLKLFDMATGQKTASFPSFPTKPDENSPSPPLSADQPPDIDEMPLLEPHGVCADQNGLVFVADRRAHAVRVFDERCGVSQGSDPAVTPGRSLASYDDERHKVGLPFAVACNQRGQLAIADYVGTVRVFTYFADVDSDC